MLYTFLTVCLFGGVTAFYPNCAPNEGHTNLDIQKYTGTWYIMGVYELESNSIKSSCGRMNFNREYNGMFKLINSVAVEPYRTIVTTTVTGYNCHLDQPSRFRMKDDAYNVEYDEVVIDTDYESYAIVYRCPERTEGFGRLVLIFTREQFPSDLTVRKIAVIVIKKNITEWNYTQMNHTDCEHVHWGRLGWTQGSVH